MYPSQLYMEQRRSKINKVSGGRETAMGHNRTLWRREAQPKSHRNAHTTQMTNNRCLTLFGDVAQSGQSIALIKRRFRVQIPASLPYTRDRGGIGRRMGLKILGPLWACGFDSHRSYQTESKRNER